MGAFLVFPIMLLCSLFLSASMSDAASAISGTWKDSKTIVVNNTNYTGPTNGFLVSGTTTTAAQYQVFSPSSGTSRVYFNTGVNLSTATSGSYTSTGKTNAAETLTLTNTQATAGATTTAPTTTTAQAGTGTVQETCSVDGVGWLVCPIATFLAEVTDGAYSMAKQLLYFEVSNPFSTDPAKNPIYALWSAVRNVANVAFVMAFFAVIFSQATSIGISAYGIRKMLPRIIAAAILVNLSYYICIFAIDISNIIGSGLGGLIGSLPDAAPPKIAEGNDWKSLVSGALATSAALGIGVAMVAWATGTVFAFLALSLLAIVTAVAIFMARTVLLIMLIILAPLAFVAYILPNTENLFDKWRKAFIAMLVMFPLVSILFAGSDVASQIMRSTADQVGGNLAWLYKLFSLAVLAIPLFGVPWIVKFSGGFIGRVAGIVNDRGKGLVDRSRNKGNEMAQSNRARSTKWGEGAGRDEHGVPLSGVRNKFKRGIGRSTAFGTGYSERAKRKQAKRESEINRIHNESFMDRLNEKEENEQGQMVYTARAQKLAKRAAGPGGEAGMLRVQQSAFQEHIKHLGEERAQASLAMEANGMYGKGTYFEYADDGKTIVASHNNTGLALAALAQGKKVGVVAAGVQAFDENGNVNMGKLQTFDGSASATANAAKERIAKTGDGAAFGYVMHGGEDASAVEITTDASGKVKRGATKAHKVKALEDKNYDDFMQFVGDNAGASIGKVPHLFKADDAFTGVNAEQIADWHGTELRSAASRIVQLREKAAEAAASGNVDAQKTYSDKADKHEKAMIQAWNAFQQDPQLAGKRSEKKEADFQSALDIIQTGTSARKALREYGDSTDGSGALVTRYAVGGKTSTVEPVIFASKQPGGTAATVEVGSNEEVTQGGLIVPHGTTRGAAASAAASNPGPAPSPVTPAPVGTPTAPTPSASPAPAPSSSGPAPAPSAPEPTSREQRESGGNFGGFRYEPPQQTPPSGASQGGGSFDASGRFTPNRPDGSPMSPDEADEYHRRFGGGN